MGGGGCHQGPSPGASLVASGAAPIRLFAGVRDALVCRAVRVGVGWHASTEVAVSVWCWLRGHATRLVPGAIACTRCGAVLEQWMILRPEVQVRAQRAHDQVIADREQRAAAMTPRPTLVRRRA